MAMIYYFVRAFKMPLTLENIIGGSDGVQLTNRSASTFTSVLVAPQSPNCTNVISLCFLKMIGIYEPLLQHVDISDGVDLPDDYQDEIAMISLSQIVDTI